MERSSVEITYHGRTGFPMIHETEAGRQYIMVRAKGGGNKRLYEDSLYKPGPGIPERRLVLRY